MRDLVTAIGLILFLEGIIIAIFPSRIKIILKSIEKISENKLRYTGVSFLVIGFLIIWYIRN